MIACQFIKKILVIMVLASLLMSCATRDAFQNLPRGENNTQLGKRYLLGRGVTANNEKAFYYFLKAANEGDPFAQNEVAYLYLAGLGTSRNVQKAFYYYNEAAKKGLASAEYNLSLLYKQGLGTKENLALSQSWLQKSANHGFLPAKKLLMQDNN